MRRQSNIFRSLFGLTVLLAALFLPSRLVHAENVCLCSANNKDCQSASNPYDQFSSPKGCENLCKTKLGIIYQSTDFGFATDGDAKKFKCEQAHQEFLKVEEAKKATGPTETKQSKQTITPKLNVDIPGLKLTDAIVTDTTVKSSFLADYINAVYKYLLGIGITIGIVMAMIGGLQYVLAAHSGSVKKGKERITNAIVGIIILSAVFLILQTVNPQLVSLKMVELQNVPEEGLGNNEVTDLSDANASYPTVTITAGQLPQFKQCGNDWKKFPYKGVNGTAVICGPNKHSSVSHEDNICESGCGVVSTAVVLGYYGQNVSPPLVADVASNVGAHTSCSGGTNLSLLCKHIPKKWPDMTCKGISTSDTKTIANFLTQKKPVVFSCHGCTGKLSDGSDKKYKGHYMVLTGISGNNFTVFDVGKQNGIVTIPISEFTSGKITGAYLIEKKK